MTISEVLILVKKFGIISFIYQHKRNFWLYKGIVEFRFKENNNLRTKIRFDGRRPKKKKEWKIQSKPVVKDIKKIYGLP